MSTVPSSPGATRALDGLQVVEMGGFISAAYATKLLADLGADVLKIEPPGGDPARRHGPFPDDRPNPERSGLFLFLNSNKRSAVVDVRSEDGVHHLRSLLADADVLVHNEHPDDLHAAGIDPDTLVEDYPHLVVVTISTYGLEGDVSSWRGNALTACAASGLSHRIGDPDREPLALPYAGADYCSGTHAAAAALTALVERRRSGLGQHVSVAAVEVLGSYMGGGALPVYIFDGQVRHRSGDRQRSFYPWQVVPVADGYFSAITKVDDQWRRFVDLIGNPDLAADPRLQNRWLASQWSEALDEYWYPWMAERTRDELTEIFRRERIAFQPVNRIDEVAESEHLRGRDFWATAGEGEHAYRTLGPPYRLSESRFEPPLAAPALGTPAGGFPRRRGTSVSRPAGPPSLPPLAGIRVLDHGHVWAGPLLGQALAELGAEVIKVQPRLGRTGVDMGGVGFPRTVGERAPGDPSDPARYHGYDRGKHSVTLNLKSPEGRALYLRLLRKSDIVIENFGPHVMPRLGLGYQDLAAVHPGVIMVSMSAAGSTPGPWRDLVTYGPSLAALYGIKSVFGYADDPQPREDTADLDPTAASYGLVAVCAALEQRARTRRGQHIEIAQGEAGLQRLAEPLFDYWFNGRVAGPQGNRYAGFVPHGIYPCAGTDEWVAIAVASDAEWDRLLEVASADTTALRAPRFASTDRRQAAEDDLDRAMAGWTRTQDPVVLVERLQAARVMAARVLGPVDLLADEDYLALVRSGLRLSERTQIGLDQVYQGVPWKFSRTPAVLQGPIPDLGQGNRYVLSELLGLPSEELESLTERGVI
jgi:crotonobetainyl-CoA:carnitine CoA-transferase CaiB-like acyl-CoA transferase